ncbi:MAG: ABC transporter ATP-binding protein [Gammaproteobacteria bacterium]|nr:ABC transporter ATP-binding protein [Gammaproteobacteria bacterium]
MSDLLEIKNLNVEFKTPRGRVKVLRDINFTATRGKILGIVGESGSGKSTVIWAMTQLLAGNAVVNSGEILFDGENVLDFNTDQLKAYRGEKASIVFQDPMTSQIPVRSYAQQMVDIAYRRSDMSTKDKLELAIKMLRQVGIPDPEQRISQYPHQFSGGMRQRAGIAMALQMSPLMLIGDEPTTALDVTMEAQIIHLLRELQQQTHATLMIVSHNLGLIAELCDEVVVMYAGQVVEKGDVHQIFNHAQHPYTQALLECDPARVLKRTRYLPTIPGDLPDLHDIPKGCIYAGRCAQASAQCLSTAPASYDIEEGHQALCHLLDPDHDQQAHEQSATDRVVSKTTGYSEDADNVIEGGQPLLSVKNVQVRFDIMGKIKAMLEGVKEPYVDAVLDISLDLRRGETLGLVGESGSGKTTLGRAILGLVKTHAGSVQIDGQEVSGLSEAALRDMRQNMAMMFQDPIGSLSPRQTIASLITEPFDIHRKGQYDALEEAKRLCDMVNLPHTFLSRYPHELSGGQARRVGVARALALEPSIIIADEPTAGLDVSVQGEILNLMRDLQIRQKLAYLIITHNLPVVRHISDRLAIMYLSRIVEQGDCDAIFDNPAHPYTEALVKGIPQPDPGKRRDLITIAGEVPSLTNRPSGCEFHTRCPYVQDRCKKERPLSQTLSDGRSVQCHFPLFN